MRAVPADATARPRSQGRRPSSGTCGHVGGTTLITGPTSGRPAVGLVMLTRIVIAKSGYFCTYCSDERGIAEEALAAMLASRA